MPRVLITGGLGFIGGTVAAAFREKNWDVVICDDLSNNTYDPEAFSGVVILCDVAECISRIALSTMKLDLVVHCASPVGAAGVLPWRGTLSNEIVRTTHACAIYCTANRVPFVNISTSEVYGFSGTYHETDALRVPAYVSARVEYAVGKLAAETSTRLLPGLHSVSVRPFNVVGAEQRMEGGFVLPTFAEQAVEGVPLTVYGDGTQQRAFLAVEDLASFITGLQYHQFDGRVVNVGTPSNAVTINELAATVIDCVGTGCVVYTDGKAVHGEAYEEAEGHIKLPDVTLAVMMGWQPRHSLADIVASAVERAACL